MHEVGSYAGRVVILMFLSVLASCARIESEAQSIQLQDRTNNYRKAIRWGEYETALPFVRRRDGTPYLYDADLYSRIRVTEMEILTRDVFLEPGEAVVTSEIEFYHEDYGSVRTLVDRQTWWFDPVEELWFLDGTLPDYASALAN